ncbi:MAG: 30S ribosomal protein S16 [Bacteroidales bacterium]|nr:30S ribosomal protein S16 [Bacteroidales bacterium]
MVRRKELIVIADGRAPRDGRYIERLGTYNPVTKPATIDLDFDRALEWLQHGAQPTNTVRAILSFKGVMMKNHLQKGVNKGALTQEQADAKFKKWLEEKEAKIEKTASDAKNETIEERKSRLSKEKEVNELRAQELRKRREVEMEAQRKEEKAEEPEAEEPKAEEAKAEEAKAEKPKAEEAKAEEAKAEKPKAEEAKAEEAKAEKPKVEEAKAEEAKAEKPRSRRSQSRGS